LRFLSGPIGHIFEKRCLTFCRGNGGIPPESLSLHNQVEGPLRHLLHRNLPFRFRPASAVRSSDDDIRIRRWTGHRLERLRTSDSGKTPDVWFWRSRVVLRRDERDPDRSYQGVCHAFSSENNLGPLEPRPNNRTEAAPQAEPHLGHSNPLAARRPHPRPRHVQCRDPTREALASWLRLRGSRSSEWLFPSRSRPSNHVTTRQYGRLLDDWIALIGLNPLAMAPIAYAGRRSRSSTSEPATCAHASSYSAIAN
jgi:hypothetical protein